MDAALITQEAVKGAAKKAGEIAVSGALGDILRFVGDKFGKAAVLWGAGFQRYLDNAVERYNQVKTLATGTATRTILGPDSIYVNLGVEYNDEEISTLTVDPLLEVGKHIVIEGSGGLGKTMLMRYLFLNTAYHGDYVPILIDLRDVEKLTGGELSIPEAVLAALRKFDAELPDEQFLYSLRLGKYLFLFDGFDEVREAAALETAQAIQDFCAKFPYNPCLITSRPREGRMSPLETFTFVKALPLRKEQAVALAGKLWKKDEKTEEFCRQLDESLFEKHRSFAENPLLLSMMFLTFMRSNTIPEHLAEFYQKAFDALYSSHDSTNKGYFRREFACTALDETRFKTLLGRFCFHTYMKESYEFTREELLYTLRASIDKLGYQDVRAADFLADLRNIVCLIVREGDTFRFAHRSFQTYFAAWYTANVLTDEQQKRLFKDLLKREYYIENVDYYILLFQIQSERFQSNVLEDGLRDLMEEVDKESGDKESDKYRALLKKVSSEILATGYVVDAVLDIYTDSLYRTNLTGLFRRFLLDSWASSLGLYNDREKIDKTMRSLEIDGIFERLLRIKDANRYYNYYNNYNSYNVHISYLRIDTSGRITEEERDRLYSAVILREHIPELYIAIKYWLSKRDAKREKLPTPDYLDEL